MLNKTSPYHSVAANLRDNGYHAMPIWPGKKIPGSWDGSKWGGLPGWAKFCDTMPPEFMHSKWEGWDSAGVCVAHGAIIGLDLDTDRKDVSEALHRAIVPSDVRRRGAKGWMGYYRPGDGLDGLTARVRWYDGKQVVCEILLHGTQSVVPPTIHPDTGAPYTWVMSDTLENTPIDDLPLLSGVDIDALNAEFEKIGLTQKVPTNAGKTEYAREITTGHDLEKTFGRSLNDRAMEPAALDQWWPALGMPKTKQRGHGAWEAIAEWRGSGSGRAIHDRNPNLKATPNGIRDFGDDKPYTPADVVMAARGCEFHDAVEWLGQYIRPEEGMTVADILHEVAMSEPNNEQMDEPGQTVGPERQSALERMLDRGKSGRAKPKPIKPTSKASFKAIFPDEVPPFPVQDFDRDLGGLLGELTRYIDEAANMRSEQGSFGAALAMLGTIMGKCVEVSETGLRTNIYIIGTAESGAGKSSAMNAMNATFDKCGVADRLAGSDFTSGTAILREMSGSIPRIFSIDEFGDVMHRALNPKAASHERDIGRIMKDMYSAAAGIYRGKAYATQQREDITEPHLCIYGVSTHEVFWEGLDGRSFNDGLLARFIMIPIGDTETQTPCHNRLNRVHEMISDLLEKSNGHGNLSGAVKQCKGVMFDDGIWNDWMADRTEFQRHAKRAEINKLPGAPSIIQRICENAMKIAMIHAFGKDPVSPMVQQEDYDIGMAVAHWSAIYMIDAIDKYYVENSSHKDLKRVYDYIEAKGGEGAAKTEMSKVLGGIFVNSMAGKNIIQLLVDSGQIVEWTAPRETRGAVKTWRIATKHVEKFFKLKGITDENL